jgi:hypothetical protein
MAGTINADTLKADSNLRLQVASANVAFIDANGLTIVGNSLNIGGVRIVVSSNNSISTSNVVGANILTTTGTTALGITANGQITTANAPFILTGGQIQFPATQIASGDGNCLDDYEEGTWTPVLGTGSGSPVFTYNYRGGTYVKIGRQVIVWFFADITVTSAGAASPGFNTSSLPIAPRSNSGLTGSSGTNGGFMTNNGNGNNNVTMAFFNLANPASADFVYFNTVTKTGGATGLATGLYGGYLFYEAN